MRITGLFIRQVVAVAVLGLATVAGAQASAGWVATWGCAQQRPEPQNAMPAEDLRDATVRQIVHVSLGGTRMRVRVSNAFGTGPLRLTGVHVARAVRADGPEIEAGTDRALLFGGSAEVTLPAGAEYVSDAVEFRVGAMSDVAISFHVEEAPAQQTGHPGSRATSYVVHGDAVGAARMDGAKRVEHWYQISEVDVEAAGRAGTVVALGDSITDGHGATTNANDRWPDVLARRMQANGRTRGVGMVNAGIGGNRMLLDGLGPNAMARFDRDVVARPGVRWVIVLEGVNDLGTLTREKEVSEAEHAELVRRIEGAYGQMVERAHAHGIRVFGATITPYLGSEYYHPGAASEADRQAINAWIRTPGRFDGVIDFDKVVGDVARPGHLRAEFDSGDHLHPSAAGYRAMGGAIPLGMF